MYAHKVVEWLGLTQQAYGKKTEEFFEELSNTIDHATKFYCGNRSLYPIEHKKRQHETRFVAPDLRLPFSVCWFDWDIDTSEVKGGANESSRRAVLAIDIPKKGCWAAMSFFYSDTSKQWRSSFCWFFISRGCLWSNNEFRASVKIRGCHRELSLDEYESAILPLESVATEVVIKKGYIDSAVLQDQADICDFEQVLKLFTCKNVTTQTTPAPAKLNKKRVKTGKLPIYEYKTLHITLPGKNKKNGMGQPIGTTQRLHMCRGHFKEYTEDAPLFGRFTGRYWWQPSVRGDKSKGEIKKDYVVNVNAKAPK